MRGVRRGRGGRVPGREGRPGEAGELAEVGASAVHQDLGAVGQQVLAHDDQQQEADGGPAGDPALLDHERQQDDHDQAERAAEQRDVPQHGRRRTGGVLGAEARRGEIPLGEAQVAPDHEQQQADADGADDDDRAGHRQREAGRRLRVDASPQHLRQPAMTAHLRADGGGLDLGRGDRRVRPAPDEQRHQTAGDDGRHEIDDHRPHGCSSSAAAAAADQPHVCPRERWVNVIVAMGISLSVAHDDADPGGARTGSASSVRGARTDHTTDHRPAAGAANTVGFLRPGSDDLATHWVERTKGLPPAVTVAGGYVAAWAVLAASITAIGLLLTKAVLSDGHGRWDESINRWLADHRVAVLEPRDQRRHVHGQHVARGRAARAGRRRARAAAPLARGALPRRRTGLRAHGLPGGQRGRRPAAPGRPPPGLDPVDEQLPLGPHRGHARALVRHGADRERHRPQPGGADRRVGRRRRW